MFNFWEQIFKDANSGWQTIAYPWMMEEDHNKATMSSLFSAFLESDGSEALQKWGTNYNLQDGASFSDEIKEDPLKKYAAKIASSYGLTEMGVDSFFAGIGASAASMLVKGAGAVATDAERLQVIYDNTSFGGKSAAELAQMSESSRDKFIDNLSSNLKEHIYEERYSVVQSNVAEAREVLAGLEGKELRKAERRLERYERQSEREILREAKNITKGLGEGAKRLIKEVPDQITEIAERDEKQIKDRVITDLREQVRRDPELKAELKKLGINMNRGIDTDDVDITYNGNGNYEVDLNSLSKDKGGREF